MEFRALCAAQSARLRLLLAACAIAIATGCQGGSAERSTKANMPLAGPAFAFYESLVRKQYASAEPVAVQQEISCETSRLVNALGYDSVTTSLKRIHEAVKDSVGPAAVRRVKAAIELRGYQTSGPICQPLKVRTDSLYPLNPS